MGQKRPYMPTRYKNWMANAKASLEHQVKFTAASSGVRFPLDGSNAVRIVFWGPMRGDLDNLSGSVLDAMNDLVIKDDNVKYISHLELQWLKEKTNKAKIEITVDALGVVSFEDQDG